MSWWLMFPSKEKRCEKKNLKKCVSWSDGASAVNGFRVGLRLLRDTLTLLKPQSRYGIFWDKLLEIWVVCPQNRNAVLKGIKEDLSRRAWTTVFASTLPFLTARIPVDARKISFQVLENNRIKNRGNFPAMTFPSLTRGKSIKHNIIHCPKNR